MKTIGLIGGMSWESTATYYQLINESVQQTLGGLHSAKVLLCSVDFGEIEPLQSAGRWDEVARHLTRAAVTLEKAGADFIVISSNTVHKAAEEIQKHLAIPLLHIAEATAQALQEQDVSMVGLLGTRYTMTEPFYREKLAASGIETLIPSPEDVSIIDDIIFRELCRGVVTEESRQKRLAVMEDLKARGARGIILGCTELDLLVKEQDTDLPLFDTTRIHALQAAFLTMEP